MALMIENDMMIRWMADQLTFCLRRTVVLTDAEGA